MKRIFYSILAVAMISSAFMACQKEQPSAEPATPLVEAKPFYVTVDNKLVVSDPDAAPQSKATFTDGLGMSWESGDASKFCMAVTGENGSREFHFAKSITIDEKNGAANFGFDVTPASNTSVSYFYGLVGDENIKGNYLCVYKSAQTQAVPGNLDAANFCLKAMDVKDGAALKPELVGNLLRFLIYSPTGKYANESVKSVKLFSSAEWEWVVAAINYDYLAGNKKNNIYTQSPSLTVTVTTPSTVTATNQDDTKGHGIYMSTLANSINNYTYVITTDVAVYVLPAVTRKELADGMVTNVFVNLENTGIVRHEGGEQLPVVRYVGGLPDEYYIKDAKSGTVGLSYYYAIVDGKEQKDNHDLFYGANSVRFAYTGEQGTPVDWISCKYRDNETWWDVTYAALPEGTESRTAFITATYNVQGYIAAPVTKTVKVTQKPAETGTTTQE